MERAGFLARLGVSSWRLLIVTAFGLVLLGWLINTPAGLLGKADAIGYAVCHRIDLRSFFIGERQFPLCMRCSGMYLGALLGLAFMGWRGGRRAGLPPLGMMLILGLATLAFVIDGTNSFLTLLAPERALYPPQNGLRLATGTAMGLVIASFLYPAFNQSVWRNQDNRPILSGWKDWLLLIGLAVLLNLALLTQHSWILYPLALLSAAGVLVILALAAVLFWLVVLRRERQYDTLIELFPALIAGLTLAIIQIGLLDWVRYILTGTWEGFHLG